MNDILSIVAPLTPNHLFENLSIHEAAGLAHLSYLVKQNVSISLRNFLRSKSKQTAYKVKWALKKWLRIPWLIAYNISYGRGSA